MAGCPAVPSVFANLLQNPGKFPLVNVFLPTLLRKGVMWLLRNESTDMGAAVDMDLPEERYLLEKDTGT